MIGMIRSAALVSVLLALATPSAAQDALNKRVSLDLKAMAPRDAFNVIATAIGFTVDVAPDVSAPIDILVGNITARTALNTICESIGCAWQASGTVIHVRNAGSATPVVIGRAQAGRAERSHDRATTVAELRRLIDQRLPADMKFENAPLTDVARRLSEATGVKITFSGGAGSRETFSGDLGNQPLFAAVKAIGERVNGEATIQAIVADRAGSTGKAVILSIRPRPRR